MWLTSSMFSTNNIKHIQKKRAPPNLRSSYENAVALEITKLHTTCRSRHISHVRIINFATHVRSAAIVAHLLHDSPLVNKQTTLRRANKNGFARRRRVRIFDYNRRCRCRAFRFDKRVEHNTIITIPQCRTQKAEILLLSQNSSSSCFFFVHLCLFDLGNDDIMCTKRWPTKIKNWNGLFSRAVSYFYMLRNIWRYDFYEKNLYSEWPIFEYIRWVHRFSRLVIRSGAM